MRIKELHLENFRGFEKLDIVFPENSNVAVFIGENGSGKTSVLDAIGKILYVGIKSQFHVNAIVKDLSFLNISDDEINKKTKRKPIIKVNFKNGLEKHLFDEIELSDTSQSIGGMLGIRTKLILNLFSYYNYHSDLEILFSDSISYQADLSKLKGIATLGHEDSKIIIDLYKDALKINLTNKKSTIAIFEKWFLSLENKELQTIFDEKNFNFRLPELEIFRYSIKTFYNNLNDVKFDNLKGNREKGEKIFDNSTQWIELTKGDEALKLNQLSSGELTLLMLITDITRRLLIIFNQNRYYSIQKEKITIEQIQQAEGIILIDEIDLHLHPKWQRNILPALAKTFPNVQFIVTTHSPQVLSNIPKNSVFLLENNQLSDKDIYTEGRDSNSILQDAFGIAEVEERYRKELQEIYTLIDVGNATVAQEKLEKLIEKRGENDREVVRMKSYIDFL